MAAVGKSSAIIKPPILNSDATILSWAGRYPTYSAQKGRRLSSVCDYLEGKPVRDEAWSVSGQRALRFSSGLSLRLNPI